MNTGESHHILQRFRSDDVNLVEVFDNLVHCILFRHETRQFGLDEQVSGQIPDNMIGNGLMCLEYGRRGEQDGISFQPLWAHPLLLNLQGASMSRVSMAGPISLRRLQYFTRAVNILLCSGHVLLEHTKETVLFQRGNAWEEEQGVWVHGQKVHQDGLGALTNTVCILNERDNLQVSNLTDTLQQCIDHTQCLCCPRVMVGSPTGLVQHIEEPQEYHQANHKTAAWPTHAGLYTRRTPQVHGLRVCIDLVCEGAMRQCVEQWDIMLLCPEVSGTNQQQHLESSKDQLDEALDEAVPSLQTMQEQEPLTSGMEGKEEPLLTNLARLKLHAALSAHLALVPDNPHPKTEFPGTQSLNQLFQRVQCLSGKQDHVGRGTFIARLEPLVSCVRDTADAQPVLAELATNIHVQEELQHQTHHGLHPASMHSAHVVMEQRAACRVVVQYRAAMPLVPTLGKQLEPAEIQRMRQWGGYFGKLLRAKQLTSQDQEQSIQWLITGLDLPLQKLSHFLYRGVFEYSWDLLDSLYGPKLAYLLVITSRGYGAMEECVRYIRLLRGDNSQDDDHASMQQDNRVYDHVQDEDEPNLVTQVLDSSKNHQTVHNNISVAGTNGITTPTINTTPAATTTITSTNSTTTAATTTITTTNSTTAATTTTNNSNNNNNNNPQALFLEVDEPNIHPSIEPTSDRHLNSNATTNTNPTTNSNPTTIENSGNLSAPASPQSTPQLGPDSRVDPSSDIHECGDNQEDVFIPLPLTHLSQLHNTSPTEDHNNNNNSSSSIPSVSDDTQVPDSPFDTTDVGGAEPVLSLLALVRQYPRHQETGLLDYDVAFE